MPGIRLFAGINAQADPNNMTELEGKHIPSIDAPQTVAKNQCFKVQIEVGRTIAHPNQPDHFIEYLDLYADDTYLARISLTAMVVRPKAVFWVTLGRETITELRALARCNRHGTWLGVRPIIVR